MSRLYLNKALQVTPYAKPTVFETGVNCDSIERTDFGFSVVYSENGETVLVPWGSVLGAFPGEGVDWVGPYAPVPVIPRTQPKPKPRKGKR